MEWAGTVTVFHILTVYHSREMGSFFDDFLHCINKNVTFKTKFHRTAKFSTSEKRILRCREAEEFGC